VDGLPITLTVKSVTDARTIEASGTAVTSEPKSVALVGREVKDFMTVDYQQINMTAVSALQEVDRRLQAVDQRVQEVEKRELRVQCLRIFAGGLASNFATDCFWDVRNF
jgi:hypothetical protein